MNQQIGMFSNIAIEDYIKAEGLSRSNLIKLINGTPLHFWDATINPNRKPEVESESMELGSLLHVLVSEENKLDDLYVVAPKIDKRFKENRELWKKWQLENQNKILVDQEEFDQARGMRDSIMNHKDASALIKNTLVEQTIFYQDPHTDILLKARPDIFCPINNYVVDLKTTKSAALQPFARSILDFGYHIQAAMIIDGIHAVLDKNIKDYFFIAVEKKSPFAVAVRQLTVESIEIGREKYKNSLLQLKKCYENNEWPGYDATAISLPSYAF